MRAAVFVSELLQRASVSVAKGFLKENVSSLGWHKQKKRKQGVKKKGCPNPIICTEERQVIP